MWLRKSRAGISNDQSNVIVYVQFFFPFTLNAEPAFSNFSGLKSLFDPKSMCLNDNRVYFIYFTSKSSVFVTNHCEKSSPVLKFLWRGRSLNLETPGLIIPAIFNLPLGSFGLFSGAFKRHVLKLQ